MSRARLSQRCSSETGVSVSIAKRERSTGDARSQPRPRLCQIAFAGPRRCRAKLTRYATLDLIAAGSLGTGADWQLGIGLMVWRDIASRSAAERDAGAVWDALAAPDQSADNGLTYSETGRSPTGILRHGSTS